MHRHVLAKDTNPSNRPKLGQASARPDSPSQPEGHKDPSTWRWLDLKQA